jgi:hypothetical protein
MPQVSHANSKPSVVWMFSCRYSTQNSGHSWDTPN